jgi:hypothetical protein
VDSNGLEGNGGSGRPSLSADGRYIAFDSDAFNLVSDDQNNVSDVFVHDRHTGETRCVSVNADGDWNDPREHIISERVDAGSRQFTFAVPDEENDVKLGHTFARFRLHSEAIALPPTGPADSGEVEDHAVIIGFDVTNPDQVAKLLADDGAADDFFGWSVSVSGDTAVVGASRDGDDGPFSGSACVFTRNGSVWTQQDKLTASDAALGDQFGDSVAVSVDTAVVGALGNDDHGADSGSAYVFTRSGSSWTEQAKVTATDGAADDYFGCSVALSGDTVVVGADWDDDNGEDSGSAYIFDLATNYDYGDAPEPYPTTQPEGGAFHEASGPTLGAYRDSETDDLAHSPGANADDNDGAEDDEDGVTKCRFQFTSHAF